MFHWLLNTADRAETELSLWASSILALVMAATLVFMANRNITITGVIVTLLLGALIFLLISSATGSNMEGSLPSTTYPIPPHLGLGAVTLENRYPHPLHYNVPLNNL